MREIKFRAWEKILKVMLLVDGIHFNDGRVQLKGQQNRTDNSYIEIMQFTGLLDKNGAPIYEGDIIFCEFEKSKFLNYSKIYLKKWIHEVKWEDQGWNIPNIEIEFRETIATSMHNDGKPTPQWEIIGNIYQDSNLLKNGIQ